MSRTSFRRAAGLVIMASSVAYVGWRILSDDEARHALGSVAPTAIVGLIVLQAVYLLPQAYRYLLVLRQAADRPIPLLGWFRLFVLGRFLNSLIPQAGTVYRGIRLREDYDVPVARYLGGFVAFTWLSTLLNLAAASVVVAVLEPDLMIGNVSGLVITLSLLVALAFGPPAFVWLVRRFRLEGDGFWGWASRRFEELLASTAAAVRSRATLIRFVAVGLVALGIAVLIFGLAFDALDLEVSASTVVMFFVLLQLSTYVNITPGNLGLLEIGFGALGSQLGVGLTGGLLVAALIRFSGYVALVLVGLSIGGITAFQQVRGTPELDQTNR